MDVHNINLNEFLAVLQSSHGLERKEFDEKMQGFLKHPVFNSVMLYSNQSIRIVEHQNFQYLFISENIKNLVGFTPEQLKQKGVFFTYSRVHPGDFVSFMSVVYKVYKAHKKMTKEEILNSCFRLDVRFKCKDGRYKRILQQCYNLELDSGGKPSILLFVSSDISNIKTRNTLDFELSIYYPGKGFEVVLEEWKNISDEMPISLRELEVVKLIAMGLTEKEISDKLFLSPHTVKTHRKNILTKTGLKNSAELVKEAIGKNWIN